MTEFDNLGLRGGVWEGTLAQPHAPGRIVLVQLGMVVGHADVSPLADGRWRVAVRLPVDRLTEGLTSFQLVEQPTGEATTRRIAVLPILAGQPLDGDILAELALMRAEIDLLKRELRRLGAAVEAAPDA